MKEHTASHFSNNLGGLTITLGLSEQNSSVTNTVFLNYVTVVIFLVFEYYYFHIVCLLIKVSKWEIKDGFQNSRYKWLHKMVFVIPLQDLTSIIVLSWLVYFHEQQWNRFLPSQLECLDSLAFNTATCSSKMLLLLSLQSVISYCY